ncbi:MAG: hypothetical protein H8E19_01185, partial [Deltaproteobacteria bacterium]|nr:hypothetical protein [Candidatus Desulfacyla euxinica]
MKTRATVLSLISTISFILIFVGVLSHAAEAPKKIAILPFTMNADRDLSFLRKGIVDMLSSRLAWKEKVEVIEEEAVRKEAAKFPAPLNKKKALMIGKALGADYV